MVPTVTFIFVVEAYHLHVIILCTAIEMAAIIMSIFLVQKGSGNAQNKQIFNKLFPIR